MPEQQLPVKPILQKPPGYRDPSNLGKPISRPPPRNGILPPSFRPIRRRSNCCRICYCIFFILFFVLFLLFVVLAGIFYLWYEPKLPAFHLQSFKISKFSVTNREDGTYLNAATVARIEARNPNSEITYRYGESRIGLTVGKYKETEFGSTTLPGFTQGRKNTTSLKIDTRVHNELVEDRVGSKLNSEFKSKHLVVNLRLKTSVGMGIAGCEIGMLSVDVFCGHLTLKQIDGGGDMPKCSIHALKWININ